MDDTRRLFTRKRDGKVFEATKLGHWGWMPYCNGVECQSIIHDEWWVDFEPVSAEGTAVVKQVVAAVTAERDALAAKCENLSSTLVRLLNAVDRVETFRDRHSAPYRPQKDEAEKMKDSFRTTPQPARHVGHDVPVDIWSELIQAVDKARLVYHSAIGSPLGRPIAPPEIVEEVK